MSAAPDIERIAAGLQKAGRTPGGWQACCPAHPDKTPSLALEEHGGKILVHCHAGCPQDAVIASLQKLGLWPKSAPANGGHHPREFRGQAPLREHPHQDENGNLVFIEAKYPAPVGWRPWSLVNGKWACNASRRIPYNLQTILAADGGLLVGFEGAKDADTGTALGYVTTSFKHWKREWNKHLARFSVVAAIGDSDGSGDKQVNGFDPGREVLRFSTAEVAAKCGATGKDVSDLRLKVSGKQLRQSIDDLLAEAGAETAENADVAKPRPLTPAEWAQADFPEPRYMLGCVHGYDTRGMMNADTGLGKTLFAMAKAVAMYLGRDFLHWKNSGEKVRVLYVDGEMPATIARKRLKAAFAWFGEDYANHSDKFVFLSRDCFTDMPPLDTEDGQKWMDKKIEDHKPNFIFFDNLMCLTVQSLKEDACWLAMKPWMLGIKVGWELLHHTGVDATRGYGDKSKEWFLDTVCMLEKVQNVGGARVQFTIRFPKCRRREPDNWLDFTLRQITLDEGQWTVSDAPIEQSGSLTRVELEIFKAVRREYPDYPLEVTIGRTEFVKIIRPIVASDIIPELENAKGPDERETVQARIRQRISDAIKKLKTKNYVVEREARLFTVRLPIQDDPHDEEE